MTDPSHVDGNALGGMLGGVFAVDFSLVERRCGTCGFNGPLGAHRVYRSAGVVVRCPTCDDVAVRAIERDGAVSVAWTGVFSVPAPA